MSRKSADGSPPREPRLLFVHAQKLGDTRINEPKIFLAHYGCMSLEWIAAGVVICLFGMIALMPSFDGNWDS